MNLDIVNACFEFFGAAVSAFNVRSIVRDKQVQGFNPMTTVFFTSWGIFNMFYYPSLEQWWSFFGGLAIVLVNAVWLFFVCLYYVRNNKENLKQRMKEIHFFLRDD